ncbi:protein-L-isoaspartate(D-aspartate) O-methyltransferase [Alkalicoccus daliensis]|uniref:Protein-L-isoaspartate O-methyltransferase n=1 Tax=Alkalicoccus daliensis TaxID=745820 RepID=A0A1H0FUP5_9BACI|nr:protein-L-isoaspartate(D-aspartate) O-methyltransferase [Alkalicoccus daliensis]SDN98292.1 protein-L-isoaspartate(D-aspartate) O-methyltransferase [Alkalicoccus daliensis]
MEEQIRRYFRQMDRSFYMTDYKEQAHLNRAFPIGHGQTISQPSLVLDMTLALDLHPQHKVLEIGTGSGFQTDILAAHAEKVYTVERIEELYLEAKRKLTAKGFTNIHFKHGNGSEGWAEAAPFDRIMVTAAGAAIPQALLDQLRPEGKMLIPVGEMDMQRLTLAEKNQDGKIRTQPLHYVQFVKLYDE